MHKYVIFHKIKILIFEKAKIWKAFIEMASENDAIEAKSALDNYKIFDEEGYLNIFFSNLDSLNLNSTTIDGIGYLYMKKKDFYTLKF